MKLNLIQQQKVYRLITDLKRIRERIEDLAQESDASALGEAADMVEQVSDTLIQLVPRTR